VGTRVPTTEPGSPQVSDCMTKLDAGAATTVIGHQSGGGLDVLGAVPGGVEPVDQSMDRDERGSGPPVSRAAPLDRQQLAPGGEGNATSATTPPGTAEVRNETAFRPGYLNTPEGIHYNLINRRGDAQSVRLSNWGAQIVADVSHDDGGVPRRAIIIEAQQDGRTATFEVSSEELVRVQDWALKGLGATARIYVYPQAHQHLLLAIQESSGHLERRTVFTHTGWRLIDGQMSYLHGGGAICAAGPLPSVRVELPAALRPQKLPAPSTGAAERAALRTSLDLLALAPDAVMVSVLGAMWRAPLGESQLVVWVTGPTGAGKTEVTAVAQQHFGASFDAHHLPAAWSGTANSLNEIAFLAKDMLLTIDDFIPKGPASTVARLHATADQVIRAQGNGAGRSRLDAESRIRESRPPRGTLLASGEDVPQGQSLRARMLDVDLGPKDLDFTLLTTAQRRGRESVLAAAMSGYVRWLAGHPQRLGSVGEDVDALRKLVMGAGVQGRTSTLVAQTALGWRTVIDYGIDCGALQPKEAELLWQRVTAALLAVGQHQREGLLEADPTTQFLDLVGTVLSSGQAHLATLGGLMPSQAQRWGWRLEASGPFSGERHEQGRRIGYVDADDIYLLPDAVMQVVAALSSSGESITLSKSALAKRLRERAILLADEHGTRGTLTVRITAEGRRVSVWHIRATNLGADAN
jgi:hypothetical protein